MARAGSGSRALAAALVLAQGLLWGLPARAQERVGAPPDRAPEAPATPVTAEPPAAAPSTIPASEIAQRSQHTQAVIADVGERIQPRPEIEAIEEAPPDFREAHRAELAADGSRLAQAPSLSVVLAIRSEWEAAATQLAGWTILGERSQRLADDVEQLAKLQEEWAATGESEGARELPQAVLERISETQASLEKTRAAARKRLDAGLTLQDQVSQLELEIADLMSAVADARERLRGMLLAYDSPPIWQDRWSAAGVFVDSLDTALSSHGRTVVAFFAKREGRLAALVMMFLVLTILISALRPAAARWTAEDEDTGPFSVIFRRRFSSALVIVILTTPATYIDPPVVVSGVVGMLLVVPTLRLLPPFLPQDMRLVLYVVATWYVLTQVRLTLVPDPMVGRLLLLVESLTALALLGWLVRPSRLSRSSGSPAWLRAIGVVVRCALPLLAVGVLSNAVGNVSLSEMLSDAALTAIYGAFILYAGARVLDGVWAALLRAPGVQSLGMVRNYRPLLRRRGLALIRMSLVSLWFYLILGALHLREQFIETLWAVLTATASVGDLEISLGDAVAFGLMIWLSFALSRFIRFILDEDLLPRASLPRGVPYAVSEIVGYTILVLGFMLAVAAAGIDMSRFAIVVGALGVGIGIGLQDIVNNFVSGLILLFERPIQTGGTVEVGEIRGDVKRIGSRASTLRTWDGAEVIIPNARFVSDQFVNWTLSDRQRRFTIAVGVAYGTDPEIVLDALLEAARSHEDALDDPAPSALFLGFGDSSLDFQVRAWTSRYDGWRLVQSEITVMIDSALRERGVTIPFPQRDLRLRSVDVDEGAVAGLAGLSLVRPESRSSTRPSSGKTRGS